MTPFQVTGHSNSLVLTHVGQRKHSVQQLPRYFHPSFGTRMSYHEDLYSKSGKRVWELRDDHCTLQSVGRGQEFVIEGNVEVENWAKGLFQLQSNDSKSVKAAKRSFQP
ncbi:MAG: hypothetical protein P0Y55_10010 [Candidatus Cohnella colombiensis]|uniref:Nucleotide modification associated domain-containing protein n=1 Tax=Candidatus Cohnella colombiensis TaxID=3121368 RepID=A0AA95EZG3_9BACL|nr:MAG: hypothetical protein P0Y55_10010 [Cohnella sp.]